MLLVEGHTCRITILRGFRVNTRKETSYDNIYEQIERATDMIESDWAFGFGLLQKHGVMWDCDQIWFRFWVGYLFSALYHCVHAE